MLTSAIARLCFLLSLSACGAASPPTDAGLDAGRASDAGTRADAGLPRPPDGGGVDAGLDAGGPELVAVSHRRELRGAWIASVFNLTWPSRATLNEAESRAEIVAILALMAELRMNAVFVQIRPESDALYRSTLEPWSRALTGTQGTDPGWDPLDVWLTEGHARGIEVHAWMNPYRGMASAAATTAATHITRTLSAHAHPWGTTIWMDPGAPEVQAHVRAVVRDVVRRYPVDGVVFDDYFYPYPDPAGSSFPDDATYAAHGGGLGRDAWRRQNVNEMVRTVAMTITEERDDVRFTISPFGIHRPGEPPGITGLDAYAVLHTEAPRWIAEGWVDTLAPQLYWPTTQTAQAFEPLLRWWAAEPRSEDRSIMAALNLARLGDTAAWSLAEFGEQVRLSREIAGSRGVVLYTIEPLLDDRLGSRAFFRDEVFPSPAAGPPLAGATLRPAPPAVNAEGTELAVSAANARLFAVYREEGAAFALDRLLTPSAARFTPTTGRWAISVIDTAGRESLGVVVVRD